MLQVAYGEMGVRETLGPKSTPRVMEYFAACGATWVKNDATPWCGAGLGWVAVQCGLPLPPEPLRARSWLDWGQECLPQQGCVVVLKRGKNPRDGHVGLLVRVDDAAGVVHVLGFNQGDAVSIAAFPISNVLGYRWPEGESRGQAMRDAVQRIPQHKIASWFSRICAFFGIGGGTATMSLNASDWAIAIIVLGLVGYIAFEMLKAGILDDYRKGNIVGGRNA